MNSRVAHIITEIQSLGVRIHEDTLKRTGGAGPAEAGSLIINDIAVNVPFGSAYVADSPYCLKRIENQLYLLKYDVRVLPVQTVPQPRYYGKTTPDGISCRKIALLHGTDCLATSVLQTCVYWDSKRRCRFCGIELSLKGNNTTALKTPDQLGETALMAERLDGVRHVVLTTGTASPPEKEFSILCRCAEAIKSKTDLAIHAQVMPPRHAYRLKALKDAGVDTVGIHIESMDMEILREMAPAKAALGLERYMAAWKAAVGLFGPNQVSSFLLAGLGENPDSLVNGSELMADLGVYPFLVPLRPIPGSLLEKALPPNPEMMKRVYGKVAQILSKKGLSYRRSLAGCVRCGACSALPAYELPVQELVCHPARTEEEHTLAMRIRKAIFVDEQHIFDHSDQDDFDAESIHLVATHAGHVIGTVRVYPAPTGNGDWIGGRLAVKKRFRASGAGELLVREAVRTVKKQGCNHFTAHIQEKNVPFFKHLGWQAIGKTENHFGRPHQRMKADLDT